MKNYRHVIEKFEKLLHKNDWPKTLFVTPGMYWDVIIASEGKIEPDWHFHPTGEDEGYPFFLVGPTMVRVSDKRTNQLHLENFIIPETREEKFVEGVEEMENKGGPVNQEYEPGLGIYPEGGINARETS